MQSDDYLVCHGKLCFGFCHIDGDSATCPECGKRHVKVNGKWKGVSEKERKKREQ